MGAAPITCTNAAFRAATSRLGGARSSICALVRFSWVGAGTPAAVVEGEPAAVLAAKWDTPDQITESGRSCWPVGPTWISVPICGQTPQS